MRRVLQVKNNYVQASRFLFQIMDYINLDVKYAIYATVKSLI